MDLVKHNLGVKALGVLQKPLHQVGALHAVHIGRPVVHLGGGHQLPALGNAGDQQGFEVGAGCVNSGGIACRARAEDQDLCMLGVGHGRFLLIAGKHENTIVRSFEFVRFRKSIG